MLRHSRSLHFFAVYSAPPESSSAKEAARNLWSTVNNPVDCGKVQLQTTVVYFEAYVFSIRYAF